jgi:hypothetical protein
MNAVDLPNTPSNPTQALADIWGVIGDIDRAQVELGKSERAAQNEKDRLEAAVLGLEPRSADDVLAIVLVAATQLEGQPVNEHIQDALHAAGRWLSVNGGASSPLVGMYLQAANRKLTDESVT